MITCSLYWRVTFCLCAREIFLHFFPPALDHRQCRCRCGLWMLLLLLLFCPLSFLYELLPLPLPLFLFGQRKRPLALALSPPMKWISGSRHHHHTNRGREGLTGTVKMPSPCHMMIRRGVRTPIYPNMYSPPSSPLCCTDNTAKTGWLVAVDVDVWLFTMYWMEPGPLEITTDRTTTYWQQASNPIEFCL